MLPVSEGTDDRSEQRMVGELGAERKRRDAFPSSSDDDQVEDSEAHAGDRSPHDGSSLRKDRPQQVGRADRDRDVHEPRR